jgi:hypothetical protein
VKKLLVAVLLIVAAAGWGQWKSGNDLVQYWQEYKKSNTGVEHSSCYVLVYQYFVLGAVDAFYAAGELSFLPKGTTGQQLFNIVGQYVDAHPAEWTELAALLVYRALLTAFVKEATTTP